MECVTSQQEGVIVKQDGKGQTVQNTIVRRDVNKGGVWDPILVNVWMDGMARTVPLELQEEEFLLYLYSPFIRF